MLIEISTLSLHYHLKDISRLSMIKTCKLSLQTEKLIKSGTSTSNPTLLELDPSVEDLGILRMDSRCRLPETTLRWTRCSNMITINSSTWRPRRSLMLTKTRKGMEYHSMIRTNAKTNNGNLSILMRLKKNATKNKMAVSMEKTSSYTVENPFNNVKRFAIRMQSAKVLNTISKTLGRQIWI